MKFQLKASLLACTALFAGAPAYAAIDVNNSFTSATLYPGQISRLTLRLQNSSLIQSEQVQLENILPNTVLIADTPNLVNNCQGTVNASNAGGHGTVTISNAIIPAGDGTNSGTCTVSINVVSNVKGTYVNTIPIGALTGVTNGVAESNATAAQATLAIILQDVSVAMSTDIGTQLHGYETSIRRIRITNPNPVALTSAGFALDFSNSGYNTRIRTDLPMGSNCGANLNVSTRPAVMGSLGPTSRIDVAGGTIPADGSCEVFFTVEPSRDPLRPYFGLTNNFTMPINTITTAQGATNTLAASTSMTTYSGVWISKTFNNSQVASININSTDTAEFRLFMQNYNTTDVTNINLTDFMPSGMTVESINASSCGGTITNSPNTQLSLNGGLLNRLSRVPPNNNSCEIRATVKIPGTGTYTNDIPAGTLNGSQQFDRTQATLTVAGNFLSIGKTLNRPDNSSVYAGDRFNVTFSISNLSSSIPVTNIRIPDDLTTMGYGVRISPLGVTSNSCGGTNNVVPDATSFVLSGMNVAPGQTCAVTVQLATASDLVTATTSYDLRYNRIPANAITFDTPTNTGIPFAQSVENYIYFSVPSQLSKSFTPADVGPLGISRLRITIDRRSSDRIAMNDIMVLDNLPAGHTVAPNPNIFNGCGGTVNATPGSNTVQLTGASLDMGTSSYVVCSIEVNVQAPPMTSGATTEVATNIIPGDGIHGTPRNYFRGTDARQSAAYNEVRNRMSVSANLTRRATFVTVNKEFLTPTISGGGVSRVRITLSNTEPTAINLSGVSLTDAFGDTDMRLYSDIDATYTNLAGNPNAGGCTGGTFAGTSGGTQITLNNATIAALSSCRFEFNVTAFRGGNHINRIAAGDLKTAEGVTNPANVSSTLTVGYQIGVGKGFSPSVIETGGRSTLTLDIYNTNVAPNDETGATPAIIDDLPAGLQIVPGTVSTNCVGGTASHGVNAGAHYLRLDGGTFPASSTCQVRADVTSATTGTYLNQIPAGALRSAQGSQSPDPAEARLRVISPPTIVKSFNMPTIGPGGISSMSFQIRNPNDAALLPTGLSGVAFSDALTGMSIAAPFAITGTCAGVVTNATVGATSVNFSNISVGPSGNCTVTVPVTAPAIGYWPNQTSGATSNQTTRPGDPSNVAHLNVAAPLTMTKSFATPWTAPNTPVRMTFTITNPNAAPVRMSSPGFTDLFPSAPGQMVVAPVPNLANGCSNGTIRNFQDNAPLAAGQDGILVRYATVPANSSCQISVDVVMPTSGEYVNTTSQLNSESGTSPAASAQIFVANAAAVNDRAEGVNGITGVTAVLNAFTGDTINGVAATAENAVLSLAPSATVPSGLTFDLATGNVDVAAGTPLGTYVINYQICDINNARNCALGWITVVTAPAGDFSITKTNTPGVNGEVDQTDDMVTAGSTTTYTLTVTNLGPINVTGVVVTDEVVGGLTCPASNPVTLIGGGLGYTAFTIADLIGAGITLGMMNVGDVATLSYSCQVNTN